MAHEFESGVTVGEVSWHGLENNVAEAPKTVSEMMELGSLNWTVRKSPLYVFGGENAITSDYADVDSHVAIRRDSDDAVLGVVGRNWTPLQNADAFEVLQPLVDAGLVELDTAGSLKGGSRVYMTAKLIGERGEVVRGDEVKGSMLAYNSHDGSLKFGFKHTPIRVVCNNTLTAATASDRGRGYTSNGVFFMHRSSIMNNVKELRAKLDYFASSFNDSIDAFKAMAAVQVNPEEFFRKLLNIPLERLQNRNTTHADREGLRTFDQLMEAYDVQPGRHFAAGSAWTAYNAVTFHVDHSRGRSEESRKDAAWFGQGAVLREKAFALALAA